MQSIRISCWIKALNSRIKLILRVKSFKDYKKLGFLLNASFAKSFACSHLGSYLKL